ncbi:transcription activator-related protein [Corchorus olitorius]|uniref:Transcription activator-related protein n=1 Tax=Corchorus olitorius TaxID=93759 RepID=A0A1R3G0G7_9ROSI|nr:transcription activator-related protein [Corchorus olitorius]
MAASRGSSITERRRNSYKEKRLSKITRIPILIPISQPTSPAQKDKRIGKVGGVGGGLWGQDDAVIDLGLEKEARSKEEEGVLKPF